MKGYNNYIAALAFLLCVSFISWGQDDHKEKLQQLKVKLQNDIKLANKVLSETKKSQVLSLSEITTLQQKLKLRESLIRTIDKEQEILNREVEELQANVDTIEKKISRLKNDYAKMVRQTRKTKNKYSRLLFILSSRSFNQAIHRLEYLKQYSEYRRRQVDEIVAHQNDLNEKISILSHQKERKNVLRNQIDTEREKLLIEKEEQEKAIARLQKKQSQIIKELKVKQAKAKKLENEIHRIVAAEIRKARKEAIRKQIENEAKKVGLVAGKDYTKRTTNNRLKRLVKKKKAKLRTANKGVEEPISPAYSLTPEAIQLASNFAANKNRLPWPVKRGLVISGYGPQRHSVAKSVIINNNGIDIATEKGSKARVTFDGKVSRIIRIPGEALAIIISHGNYFTLYQNLSEVFVKSGDKVKGMQEIGAVYTNENEGCSILHFELWKQTQPLDPLSWLVSK